MFGFTIVSYLIFLFISLSHGDLRPRDLTFNCTTLPTPPPPSDIRHLKPGNIKVVMAVGDSISAGFGMHSGRFWHVLELIEYRGDVFSIGGDPDQLTVPNFLMNYNPNLIGYSQGWSEPLDAIAWENGTVQPWDPTVTHLNGAQSMAKIAAVPAQVDYITEQILTVYNTSIDMENDWKLMTVFIGANNLCGSCLNRSYADPDYYEQTMDEVLTKIYKQIPRTFVNLVTMFNISQVYPFAMQSDYCIFMWDTFCHSECLCMTKDSTAEQRQIMDNFAIEYNKRLYKLAAKWQAMNLPDFTVVVQPFTENLVIPSNLGLDFLSELDCFHPNFDADAAFAVGLWNNMLTPPSQKQTNLVWPIEIMCPDENTFIQ